MPMDLVFVLKWVKSVVGCVPYIFHLSELYALKCSFNLEHFGFGKKSLQNWSFFEKGRSALYRNERRK